MMDRLLSKVTQAYDFCKKQILQQCLSGENQKLTFWIKII